MDVIRRTDLERLALQGAGPSVAVPATHRAGAGAQQGPIRLKNLLGQATEALQADGSGRRWSTVSWRRCGGWSTTACSGSTRATAWPSTAARDGGGPCGSGDLRTERVLRYFRKVNRALREVLAGERAPMVLAAVDHLAPLWRRVNTYPHLVAPVFAGSPEELGLHELHARVWAVVEPLFLRAQDEAAARYHELAGTGLTSRDPREIVPAAKEGRIEVLFTARHTTGVGGMRGGPPPNGERALRDVLELAAVTTLLEGGTVSAPPAEALPEGGSAAAVLRYPARVPQDRIAGT